MTSQARNPRGEERLEGSAFITCRSNFCKHHPTGDLTSGSRSRRQQIAISSCQRLATAESSTLSERFLAPCRRCTHYCTSWRRSCASHDQNRNTQRHRQGPVAQRRAAGPDEGPSVPQALPRGRNEQFLPSSALLILALPYMRLDRRP